MGPLHGVRVIELESLAPAPFGCMILADLGAEVIRVDRPAAPGHPVVQPGDPLARGRRSIRLDLKEPEGVAVLLRLADRADVFVEAFRPGVAERLGFGPEACLERNPRLVYARMTGWGQDGPLAPAAGHDIDYIAVAGTLDPIGRAGERPVPPLNLVGDFGGGGMLLAVGVLAALLERERSGRGQVVDAAMVDGAALLATFIYGLRAAGAWRDERGSNLLDGGAPFYDTYPTADGKFVAVGALEPKFYAELLAGLGLDPAGLPGQYDRDGWPGAAGRHQRPVRRADPGRVGRGLRRIGRLRGPRAEHGGRARPPAQRRPRHLHRGGRGDPARPGAAVQPDARGPASAAATAGPRHQRDPGRTGVLPGRDHRAQRPADRQLTGSARTRPARGPVRGSRREPGGRPRLSRRRAGSP